MVDFAKLLADRRAAQANHQPAASKAERQWRSANPLPETVARKEREQQERFDAMEEREDAMDWLIDMYRQRGDREYEKWLLVPTTAPRATQQPGFIRTPDFINVEKENFMSLEQTMQANTAALIALTAALVATAKLAPSAAAAAAPAATTTKAATGKAPAAAAAPAAPAAAPAGDFKTAVAPKMSAAVSRVGRDPVIAMLAEKFGAKKASEVPAEKWTELGEALDDLNAEAEDPLS